ncbi:MAG: chorismate mutase [Patescibacteria group bacterium]
MNSKSLTHLRKQIDALDRALLRLWSRRLKVAREIGKLKLDQSLSLKDREREQRVIACAVKFGRSLGLPASKVRTLMGIIIASSRQTQKR